MPKPTVMEIEIGAPVGMSQKRLHKSLEQSARDCNRVRNAMIRRFIRFHEDNPDYEPKDITTKRGETKKENAVFPYALISSTCDDSFYRLGQRVAPRLGSLLITAIQNEVVNALKNRVPYDHDGDARYKWQSILNFETSAPSYRGMVIPAPNKGIVLGYQGHVSNPKSKLGDLPSDHCVIKFGLFSQKSGWKILSPIVRCNLGSAWSRGHKRLLREMASGERKICDSKIVFKRKKWFLQLTYEVPVKDHGLDQTRTAVLVMNGPQHDRPFAISMIGKDGNWFTFGIGDGKPLEKERVRLDTRRRAMRYRSRNGSGTGHGKKKFYSRLRPAARRYTDMQDEFRNQAINDIVRSLVRHDCGKLEYREPTKPVRELSWFEKKNTPFDWVKFLGHLEFKLEANCIEVETRRMQMKEWKAKFGVAEDADDAKDAAVA